jgi:NhaP-type Na+/H+ or K+/H+ antiporter
MTETFILGVAVAASVLIASALVSGLVDRTGFPPVVLFILIGLGIGPYGAGLLEVGADSALLRIVGTLSLVFVLFTDAVSISPRKIREHGLSAFLVLVPGTLGTAAAAAVAAWWLLGFDGVVAIAVGAALASVDPVLLRGFLRRPALSAPVRETLRLESGMNDAVLLPIILICTFIAARPASGGASMGGVLTAMLIASPLAGAAVGGAGVAALHLMRRRFGVRRDYESLYSLGLALGAYAAGEAVHGSGFLAAFTAGLTVSAIDVELCECFLEYGETTAEMALLFTFVLFGVSLIWSGLTLPAMAWLFAAAVLAARVVIYLLALLPARMRFRQRMLIAWFGPRGLSTLLLVMIPVSAGVPDASVALAACCLVVVVSIVIHGSSPLLLRGAGAAPPERDPREFISADEARRLINDGRALVVDSRAERNLDRAEPSMVRVRPDHAVHDARALNLPRDKVLAVLCA